MAKFHTVDVEMYLGLKFYPKQYTESFSFINGLVRSPKRVMRRGLSALGRYKPQDIGKRVYGAQVENEEQVTKRTGLTIEQRKELGKRIIAQGKQRYKGCKTIWSTTI